MKRSPERIRRANSSGLSPPPGQTGPTTGGSRPSPPTPWGICLPAAFTCRSILSMSYVPVTPGESLPAWTPMRATTGLPHQRKTSLRSPPRCSSWTPRRSRTPTCARRPSWPPCRCPSSCRALQCCPPQGFWDSPGIRFRSWSPPNWRCAACGPTDGTPSTTGCVLVCWFWVVIMTSLRWIGVRQTDVSLVIEDRPTARVTAPPGVRARTVAWANRARIVQGRARASHRRYRWNRNRHT